MSSRNPLERSQALQAVKASFGAIPYDETDLYHQLLRKEILKPYDSLLPPGDRRKLAVASELIAQAKRDPDLTGFLRNVTPWDVQLASIAPYIAVKTGDDNIALALTGASVDEAIQSIGTRIAGGVNKTAAVADFLANSQMPLNDTIGVEALIGSRQFNGINALIKKEAAQNALENAAMQDMAAYNVLLEGIGNERMQYAHARSYGPNRIQDMYAAGLNAGYTNENVRLLATEPRRWSNNDGGAGSRGAVKSWGQYGDSYLHRL